MRQLEVICLKDEELEALFLADGQGLEQEEAAARMTISRPTFSRILAQARKSVATALATGAALRIEGEQETQSTKGTEHAE